MGCATVTIKYLVFIFNTLCALLGIGTIVVNALALENASDEAEAVCITLIVLGSVVFLIAFFGCCGALRESTCFIWTYALLLIVLITANCVIMFVFTPQIDSSANAQADIGTAWAQQLNGTDAMSAYQTTYACCGVHNSTDYTQANMAIPPSCYANGNSTVPSNLYPNGCLQILTEVYENAENLVNIFNWSTLGVESVALVCAIILGFTFRNQERRARY